MHFTLLDRYAFEKRLRPVLKHEMVHAVQLHSLDLLFMEFVVAMLWFNPLIYVLLRSIRENHEYLADHYAHGDQDSLREYLECLKAETIRYFSPVPASYFKSTTIKKRIIMLTNHNSSKSKKWRYLGILPLPEKYREKITWDYDLQAIHPITKKEITHKGIDVAAPTGTQVFASGDGVVKKAVEEKGWGKLVVVEHEDGYTTFYAHLDEIEVENGVKVLRGEVIGRVGNTGQSTGPHLHYEVRKNGEHLNPADFY